MKQIITLFFIHLLAFTYSTNYLFQGFTHQFVKIAQIDDGGQATNVKAGLIAYEYSEFGKDLDSGLVAYFPFNGNANDMSGNEHHGTVIGAELFPDRFGEFNRAYYFDGIDDVIALEDSLFSGEYLTISAWFKKLGNGADAWSSIIAGDCSAPYLGFNQNIPTFGGQCDSPMPHQWPDSAFIDIDSRWPIINPNWHHIDTNWHHIAGVYDGANIILYLDNIVLLNNYVGKFTYENSIPIGIGSSYQHFRDSESFFGVIDDVRIYDRPLNRAEISVLYDPVTGLYDKNTTIVETKYQLLQNYPNPFNPSTTIKCAIPKQSSVTLKVFDVLGSEIETLVNKEQSQGNYEVEFDGSELTSGIYFYRLQVYPVNGGAGDFIETKKMVLLK